MKVNLKKLLVKDVAIIGAGPAGMMAAIQSARKGNKVKVYEQKKSAGMKLLVTGNGRCNISNENISSDKYHGEGSKFVESVFARYSLNETKTFFKDIGIDVIEGDEGRLYPSTEKATDVLNALINEAKRLSVEFEYQSVVQGIVKNNEKLSVDLRSNNIERNEKYDAVIISTGGKSYSKLGSNGSGFRLAAPLGHSIVNPVPVSVPLESTDPLCVAMKGVTLPVKVQLKHGKKVVSRTEGNMIFTHYGCSGPAILEISREYSILTNRSSVDRKDLKVLVDFAPSIDESQLHELLHERMQHNQEKMLSNQFYDICAKSLAVQLLIKAGLDPMQIGVMSKKDLNRVIQLLKRYDLEVSDTLGWDHAQFTSGGISTKEIDSASMESKLIPGLYFAGEVVDIDGNTGGYNLQWAWSSGALAGMST